MNQVARLDLIRNLKDRVQQIETSQRRALQVGCVSTGCDAFDQILPGPGFESGTLAEWLNEGEASGAATLALTVAARASQQGGACVVIDGAGEFYPPAADDLGIPLERTVVVRPDNPRIALWAWEQALRCEGVAVTLGWIGELSDRPFRRLQLAVEAGHGLGFLLRPAACRGAPSWAAARLGVTALPGRGPLYPLGRRLRVELLHGWSLVGGTTIDLELSHEAGHVHLVSQLAGPTPARRAARA